MPKTDPPKEDTILFDVVGYRFEDQPTQRHTLMEDLAVEGDAGDPPTGRESLATGGTFDTGASTAMVNVAPLQEERVENGVAAEHPSEGAFVPPFPFLSEAPPTFHKSPASASPTTESFTSTARSHYHPSTSGTTTVSSTSTFPLAFPPKAKERKNQTAGGASRPSTSSNTESFLHFPPPPEDYEAGRVQLLVERIPPQVPILTDDYRYDSREGFIRPYRSHRCKHCAQVVLSELAVVGLPDRILTRCVT